MLLRMNRICKGFCSSMSGGLRTAIGATSSLPKFNPLQFTLQSIREMASLKHKKVIKRAKGFRGRANRCYSVAYHRVLKAYQYAYRDRKVTNLNVSFCQHKIDTERFLKLSPPLI